MGFRFSPSHTNKSSKLERGLGDGGSGEGVDGGWAVDRWHRKRWTVAVPGDCYERQGRETNKAEEGEFWGRLWPPVAQLVSNDGE